MDCKRLLINSRVNILQQKYILFLERFILAFNYRVYGTKSITIGAVSRLRGLMMTRSYDYVTVTELDAKFGVVEARLTGLEEKLDSINLELQEAKKLAEERHRSLSNQLASLFQLFGLSGTANTSPPPLSTPATVTLTTSSVTDKTCEQTTLTLKKDLPAVKDKSTLSSAVVNQDTVLLKIDFQIFDREDEQTWFSMVERFFSLDNYSDDERFALISLGLSGKILSSYSWEISRAPFTDGMDFRSKFLLQFGPSERALTVDRSHNLIRHDAMEDDVEEFQRLAALMKDLTETNQIAIVKQGWKLDLQTSIRLLNPPYLPAIISLDLQANPVLDGKFRTRSTTASPTLSRGHRRSSVSHSDSSNSHVLSTQFVKHRDRKHLAPVEHEEHRKSNLFFCCDWPWQPKHKWPKADLQARLLLHDCELVIVMTMVAYISDEEIVYQLHSCKLSHSVFLDKNSPRTTKIRGVDTYGKFCALYAGEGCETLLSEMLADLAECQKMLNAQAGYMSSCVRVRSMDKGIFSSKERQAFQSEVDNLKHSEMKNSVPLDMSSLLTFSRNTDPPLQCWDSDPGNLSVTVWSGFPDDITLDSFRLTLASINNTDKDSQALKSLAVTILKPERNTITFALPQQKPGYSVLGVVAGQIGHLNFRSHNISNGGHADSDYFMHYEKPTKHILKVSKPRALVDLAAVVSSTLLTNELPWTGIIARPIAYSLKGVTLQIDLGPWLQLEDSYGFEREKYMDTNCDGGASKAEVSVGDSPIFPNRYIEVLNLCDGKIVFSKGASDVSYILWVHVHAVSEKLARGSSSVNHLKQDILEGMRTVALKLDFGVHYNQISPRTIAVAVALKYTMKNHEVSPLPNNLHDAAELVTVPKCIRKTRYDASGHLEVLVECDGLPSHDSSWVNIREFYRHFPSFTLEDKLSFDRRVVDMPWSAYVRQRKHKKMDQQQADVEKRESLMKD